MKPKIPGSPLRAPTRMIAATSPLPPVHANAIATAIAWKWHLGARSAVAGCAVLPSCSVLLVRREDVLDGASEAAGDRECEGDLRKAVSKNGTSALEVSRQCEITEESAWFMCHRIREAMKRDPLAGMLAGVITADETFIGW
jgi:hypothetical protein